MKVIAMTALIVAAGPLWAYDAGRAELLKDDLAIAAVCLERFGDRDLFELTFAKLAQVEAENPSPTATTELQGFRDGVQDGAKEAGPDRIGDAALTLACKAVRDR